MVGVDSVTGSSARWGRVYFGLQAIAGLSWWIAVFASPVVREATLGSLDPVVVAAFDIPLFVLASAFAACGFRVAAIVSACWTGTVAVALGWYATMTTEAGWGAVMMVAAAAGSVIALCLILLGRVPNEFIIRGPFAFRPAASRSTSARHVASTFIQIVVFWGFFLVVVPVTLTALERRWDVVFSFPSFVAPVGFTILVLASGLGLWSAVAMSTLGDGTPLPSATANRLVIAGPYRWVRNPMAVSGIVQGAAVGLIVQSWFVVVYAVAGSLVWNYAVRPLEEADLEGRFGEEFQRYRDAVSCWIPRVPQDRSTRPAPRQYSAGNGHN